MSVTKPNLHYLLVLPALLVSAMLFAQKNSTFGIFKDWTRTETRVYGMLKLTDTVGREFDKISYVDSNTVKVEEYNPSGTRTSTTIVHFMDNHLSGIDHINQWGVLYRTVKFTPDGDHIYTTTDKWWGTNDYLPCKEVKTVFENDLIKEMRYMGFNGKLCNNHDGYAIIKFSNYTDSARYAREKEVSFYDENGQPVASRGRDYHHIVYERDDHGNKLSEKFYDENDHKLEVRTGIFEVKTSYDTSDNPIEAVYYGLNGEIKRNIYGVARTVNQFENGLKMETILYDDSNNIIRATDTGSGLSITHWAYNKGGFVTNEAYYNENMQPMNSASGVHQCIYKYNDANMLISLEFFSKDGEAAANRERIHRYEYQYDKKGRQIMVSYFSTDDKPRKNWVEQVYAVRFEYDSNNLRKSQSFWKDAKTPMCSWSGVHKQVFAYNDQGLQTEVVNYGIDGKLTVDSNGYSRSVRLYDSESRICGHSRFDGKTPVLMSRANIRNYHTIKLSYDEKNRINQIEYLDVNDKPINAFIGLQGGLNAYKIELKYVTNRLTEEWFYALNNSTPIKKIDCLKNDFVDPQGIIFGHKNQH
jgi:hypothetical protein